MLLILQEHNFDLDNRLVYGLDAEFDATRQTDVFSNRLETNIFDKEADEHIFSIF